MVCALNKAMLHSADITNADFQGRPVGRIILYQIPRGGLRQEGMPDGSVLAVVAPIHGTCDAARGFWLELKGTVPAQGVRHDFVLRAPFVLRNQDGNIIAMLTTNVDDLLYGFLPQGGEERLYNIFGSLFMWGFGSVASRVSRTTSTT